MKNILVLVVLMVHVVALSQVTKKVLFIGNSYIYSNDLPGMISNIANADGNTLIKDQNTIGGYTLQSHSTNATTLAKIAGNNWDYVVLQEQSQLPSFPYTQVQADVVPFAQDLCEAIRNSNDCAIPVFFDTWGRQNGDSQWDSIDTFTEMNQRLYNSYELMANANSALLSPVGIAFEQVYNDGSGTVSFAQLYSGDGSHPSVFGTYLAACIFYQQLFSESIIGNTHVPAGMNNLQCDYLQNVASEVLTVNDTIATSFISPLASFTFNVTDLSINFTNTSTHDFEWTWNFGDGNSSTLENPTHVYTSYGNYTVELIAIYCDSADTTSQLINIVPLGINLLTHGLTISGNPSADGYFILNHLETNESILIYDTQGNIVKQFFTSSKQETIQLPKGIYFVNYKNVIYKLISL